MWRTYGDRARVGADPGRWRWRVASAADEQIGGDSRPEQFCALLDKETLLDRTRQRMDLLVPCDRRAVRASRPHQTYYLPPERALAGAPDRPAGGSRDGSRGRLCSDARRRAGRRRAELSSAPPTTTSSTTPPSCGMWVTPWSSSVGHPVEWCFWGSGRPRPRLTTAGSNRPPGRGPRTERPVVGVHGFWERPSRQLAERLLGSAASTPHTPLAPPHSSRGSRGRTPRPA